MTLHVSKHAVERYQQRVADVTEAEAVAALSTPAIQAASEFGAEYIRLGSGHRVVVKDGVVITVQPVGHYKRQIGRVGVRKFGRYGGQGRAE
jgi:hypothetical protein